MTWLFGIIYAALTVLQVMLLMRIVLDVTEMFARSWRPRGIALLTVSVVARVTDPPMRWLRSRIKPLDLGGMRLDLAFIILYFATIILKLIVRGVGSSV
ncbi:YggT family protein [Paeniglutamicibacter cryotolerans]|uniref:YggT family protein n=1 Tax=Paeniglutamicibacter cryotolerans TaxID=670079 RepID=A0A839QKA5_9MICC|nr:YggT family protein [Paeniglutamicibacter cryotolerans]MBB2996639.1 YggT family protein [Paeniglutamicibacter cryotolerans]